MGRRKFNESAKAALAFLRARQAFPAGGTEAEVARFLFDGVRV